MDNFRDSPLQLDRGYNMQSIGISSSVMYSKHTENDRHRHSCIYLVTFSMTMVLPLPMAHH